MDHAAAMGEAGRLQDLDRDIDRAQRLERGLLADQLLERAARQVLHRDVVRVLEAAAVIDADHVRMLEAGGRLGLAPEAFDEVWVGGKPIVQELQRDPARQLLVLGQENVRHAARAKLRHHLVAAVDQGVRRQAGHAVTSPLRAAA